MSKKYREVKVWADIGPNGGVFEFEVGPVADRYPKLLHIFSEQITPDLIPVILRIPIIK